MVRPALRRDVVAVLQDSYQVCERRACSAVSPFGAALPVAA
jgi:hypothetical protein